MSNSGATGKTFCNGSMEVQDLVGHEEASSTSDTPPRRPPRKRFDEEMDRISNTIKTKESELRNLQSAVECFQASSSSSAGAGGNPSLLAAGAGSSSVWQQRDEIITRRRAIDERLQAANKDIANKRDAVARIHSTLNYKSDDRINEAIKRLQYQLRVNNFKVNEEKRIVKEIDNLNRSRRNLKEYLDKKSELDTILKKQQELRNERDALFRAGTELTQKGETLKRETRDRKAKADVIKKELNDLYAEKRQTSVSYHQELFRFQHYKAQQKKLAQKKEENNNDKEEVENVPRESFSEERHLCVTLLSYLQRFEFSQVNSAMTPNMTPLDYLSMSHLPISEGHTPVSPTEEVTLLRHKDDSGDEDWRACPSTRGTRARRNHTKKLRQQQKKKQIKHTPEVFEQFSRLQLSAPSLLSEVPVVIEQLKAKRKFYDQLSKNGYLKEIPDLPLYSLSSTNMDAKILASNTESPIPPSSEILQVPQETEHVEKDEPEIPDVRKLSLISTNSAPKTLDLGPNTYSLHLNGYENGLDDLDMGYSSENGYSKYPAKKSIVKLVQSIES